MVHLETEKPSTVHRKEGNRDGGQGREERHRKHRRQAGRQRGAEARSRADGQTDPESQVRELYLLASSRQEQAK